MFVNFANAGPHTIWGKLAEKLGREPTNEEAKREVHRVLDDALIERAEAGKLAHQRGR